MNFKPGRFLLFLGFLGLMSSVIVAEVVSIQHYLPGAQFPASPQALKVGWITLAGAGAALLLVWWWRGRLLLALLALAVATGIALTALLSGSWPAVLVVIWLLGLATALGSWLRRRFAPGLEAYPFERLLLSITLGLATLMGLVALMGAAGLLYSWLAWSLLVALSLLFLPWATRRLAQGFHGFREIWKTADLRLVSLVMAAVVLCLVGAYLRALAPNVRFDALNYHLGVPAQYVENHTILPVPETFNSTLVHYSEMLYVLALLTVGQPLPNLILLSFSLIGAGWVFALGRRLKSTRLGLLGVFFYLSLPTVTLESSTGYIDIILAAFVTGSLLAGLAWWQTDQPAWLVWSGVFGGIALGIKTTALMILAPEVGLFLVFLLYRHRFSWLFLRRLLYFCLPLVLLPLPWLIRDWLWTGNPIFPVLNSFFHTSIIVPPEVGTSTSIVAGNPSEFNLLQFIRLPWDLAANASLNYREGAQVPEGMAGSVTLLALPWVFALAPHLRRPTRRLAWVILLLAGLAMMITFLNLKSIRLLQPVFPLLAVLSATNFDVLWDEVHSPTVRRAFIVLGLPLLAVYLVATRMVFGAFWNSSEAYPIHFALGQESRSQFLSRNLGVYDALQILNDEAAPGTKVLSLGNEFRLYTLAHIYGPMYSPEAFHILHDPVTAEALKQALRQQNFAYLLVYSPEQHFRSILYEAPALNSQFYRQYTCLETVQGFSRLYRLVDSPQNCPNGLSGNLLANSGFEKIVQDVPTDWQVNGAPQLDPSVAHSGQVSVLIDGASSIYQDVAVIPGKTYALTYWSKASQPYQVVQNYVHWLDQDKKPLSISAEWNTQAQDWQRFDFPMIAPQRAAYARITVSVVAGNEAWVDDVCFVLGPACP